MATADDRCAARIERASPADRAFLVMGTSALPEQFGVVLLLDPAPGFGLTTARRLIGERISAVPRLRQRLVTAPLGCGGPVWAARMTQWRQGADRRRHLLLCTTRSRRMAA